ncbi:hypothetical protein BV898_00413 [Hypsibius exemplaris]|uniref:G-protein coupled receptors family 1 profile domain-containing protein n=1 Tax=Hypsibius exemplaris TaxID=2072580 RepID=A0A1W0XDN6_HYPEX|nr:hypothetical protein BV898_00413 [Hypsibius exemplaris]
MNVSLNTLLIAQSSNGTNWSYSSFYGHSLTTWFALMLTLCLSGVITNVLLIIIIALSRKLRSGTGLLILHLLCTDTLLCCLLYPIHVILVYGSNFWFTLPKDICVYTYYPLIVIKFVNNWAEASLGFNRIVAAFLPRFFRTVSTSRSSLFAVLLCWMIVAVPLFPFCFKIMGYFPVSPVGQCMIIPSSLAGYSIMTVNAYAPYGIVCCAAVCVSAKFLTKKLSLERTRVTVRDLLAPSQTAQQSLKLRRQITIARMLLISFLFCLLCNTPLSILTGVTFTQSAQPWFPVLRLWFHLCSVCQYTFTPIILFACNRDYQNGLLKLFGRGRVAPATTSGADGGTMDGTQKRHVTNPAGDFDAGIK